MLPDRFCYSSFSKRPEFILVKVRITFKIVRVARIVEKSVGKSSMLPVERISIPMIASAEGDFDLRRVICWTKVNGAQVRDFFPLVECLVDSVVLDFDREIVRVTED